VHSAVLVRFEEMNDDLGMCVWLSISPSTHDALFRSQHLKDQVSELSTARFFSIPWKALFLFFATLKTAIEWARTAMP
jgi:hypothetical protein